MAYCSLRNALPNSCPRNASSSGCLYANFSRRGPWVLTEVVSLRQQAVALLGEYFERRVAAGELRVHQPLVPLHMLISSFLILLLLDQPLEPYVEQFVETILDGIHPR